MSRRLALVLLAVWFGVVWVSFLAFQTESQVKQPHAAAYIGAVAAVVAIGLVAASAGLRILRGKPLTLRAILTGYAAGLALLGVVTLALGLAGWIRWYTVWAAVAVIGIACRRELAGLVRYLMLPRGGGRDPVGMVFLAVLVFALSACLVNCLAPLTANDALVYHLNLPKAYSASGAVIRLPYNVYANMPHYGEVLYTLFYAAAGETAAKLFYFATIVAAAGAVYALARMLVPARFAVIGACIFAVQPLVMDHRTICNIDVMLAFFYLGALCLVFERGDSALRPRLPGGLALVTGFMLGMKYTAIVPAIAVLAAVLATRRRLSLRQWAVSILIAAAIAAPWAVKNQAFVGNPVYPLFEEVFDGENWDTVQEAQLVAWQRSMGMGRRPLDYLLLPYNVSARAKPGLSYTRFDGTMSPLLLILLPLALLSRKRQTRVLMGLALAGFVFWAVTSQQLRFLIPTIAVGAVLVAVGLHRLSVSAPPKWFGAVLGAVLIVQISVLVIPDQYGRPVLSNSLGDRLPVVMGFESAGAYLERNVQSYAMIEYMNANLPQGEPVLMIWENRGYYLNHPYLADSFFEASTVMRILAQAGTSAGMARRLQAMGYRYVVVNEYLGGFFSRYYSPQAVGMLGDFVRDHLRPMHSANGLVLYSML